MAKRPNGAGTLFKRKDGRFEGRVLIGYINGKPKYKSVIRKTQKEAAKAFEELRQRQAAGVNLAPERLTVMQFLERWLTDIVAQRCRPTTYKMYGESVGRIVKHIGQVQLAKLSPHHIQQMLRGLVDAGYAPATVDRARDVLINALNTATEWQLIPRNVAKLTAPPKVEQYEAQVLTFEEAQRLLRAAHGDRLELLWRIALTLGLRKGEILGLRWYDLDLHAGTAQIAVNLQVIGGKLILVKPKTKESQRSLPLPPALVAALQEHRVQQLQARLVAGSRWKEHGLVFCTGVGTPIAPRNLTRAWHALLKRAGLSQLRFHDLRHSCASFLAAQPEKVHPKVVQHMLGHSDLRTTLRIYTHVTDEQKREAATVLDALFGGRKEETRNA